MKKIITIFLAGAAILLIGGCNTHYDTAMKHKDKALEARETTAVLALGGSVTETVTEHADKSVTRSRTVSMASAKEDAPGVVTRIEPGGTVEVGMFIRNSGTEAIEMDFAAVVKEMFGGGGQREVSPTEKLALLESYWGETGNFIPKSAYEITLQMLTRGIFGWMIYDAGKQVIRSNESISRQALSTEPTIVRPEIIQPQ
jgi:acetylornithine/succinyldiaminopimelate/putrescine aminotransferase